VTDSLRSPGQPRRPFPHGSRAAYWAAAVVFLAVYVGSMFTPGLLDDADSTHAEAAREMVVTGDYVTLHVNGVRYLEKAPLPYWLVAISYKCWEWTNSARGCRWFCR